MDLRDLPRAKDWEPGDPIQEIPRRHTHPPRVTPTPTGPAHDLLVDRQADALTEAVDPGFSTPTLNFPGQDFSGTSVPDTVGDVGPNHYIQAINTARPSFLGPGTVVTIYGKTGGVLAGPFRLETIGTVGVCADGDGEPIVLYDSMADRWLLAETAGRNLCVYISQTSDPVSGGWFRYQFITFPNFPNYPKYAVWPDAYYVSTSEASPAAYALDRNRMIMGLSAAYQRFTAPDLAGFDFQALTPADLDGATSPPAGAPGIFMRHRDDEVHNPPGNPFLDFLEVWQFHVDWANAANSTLTGPTNIAVTDFSSEQCGLSSFPIGCFPQPGTFQTLQPLREVIMWRLQYRNFGTHQSLVGNFVTDADGEPDSPPENERGGIRWFELRKTGANWNLSRREPTRPMRPTAGWGRPLWTDQATSPSVTT